MPKRAIDQSILTQTARHISDPIRWSFQARMDEILVDRPGVVGITDNVCVHDKDEEEHDRNLKALMDRAKETGLVFNSDKRTIRQPEISFFGNIYSKNGIRPVTKLWFDCLGCLVLWCGS